MSDPKRNTPTLLPLLLALWLALQEPKPQAEPDHQLAIVADAEDEPADTGE